MTSSANKKIELPLYRFASPKKIIDLSEVAFGGFCVSTLILTIVSYLRGQTHVHTPLLLIFFLASNVAFGKIVIRVAKENEKAKYHRLELFRVFVMNAIFCPVIYSYFDGPFSNFWFIYIITVISTSILLGLSWASNLINYGGLLFWLINFGVVAFFKDGLNAETLIRIAALGMIGVAITRLVYILRETIRAEEIRAIEVETTLKQLRQAESQLLQTERLAALTEMAGGVAHEINTPLATIQLHANLIHQNYEQENTEQDKLTFKSALAIERTCQRIANITQALRSFSRDAAFDAPEVFNAKDLLTTVLLLSQEKYSQAGIKIDQTPELSDLWILGRRTQIAQAVFNLLSNSFEAIQNLPADQRWIRVSGQLEKNTTKIVITDSGSGIKPEISGKIFQPFFSTKSLGMGTGLGLSVARGIIESNQGRLELDEKAANTTFVITLPMAEAPSSYSASI